MAVFTQARSQGGLPPRQLKSRSHHPTIKQHQQTGEPRDPLCKAKGEAFPGASVLEVI